MPPIGDASAEGLPVPGDAERDMAVADEDERRGRRLQAEQGDVVAQDVLPDRVARAGVEELRRRRARADGDSVSSQARSSAPSTVRVQRAATPGIAREVGEVDRAENAEVVVAAERERRPLADEAAALVRLRPVADEVAEAPDLVGLLARRSRRAPPRAREGSRGCRRRLRRAWARVSGPAGQFPGPSVSGSDWIPLTVVYFDQASCSAVRSSCVNCCDMFTRPTTTPGTSPSSTSWSTRANVSVNS